MEIIPVLEFASEIYRNPVKFCAGVDDGSKPDWFRFFYRFKFLCSLYVRFIFVSPGVRFSGFLRRIFLVQAGVIHRHIIVCLFLFGIAYFPLKRFKTVQ